ncbi:MAG: 30S ribosomal protein S20 [Bacteroidia bacterium]|nr:30S ribosomal protein S20 [Bacteroidia bacterium]
MAAPAKKKKKSTRSRTALRRQRKSLRRRERNLLWKSRYKEALRALRKEQDSSKLPELLRKVVSILDKIGRRRIFHPNKVARLKSRLTLLTNARTAPSAA